MSYDPNQPRDDQGQWSDAATAAVGRSRSNPATRSARPAPGDNSSATGKFSNEQLLANAAKMYGKGSTKYQAAVKKLGGKK